MALALLLASLVLVAPTWAQDVPADGGGVADGGDIALPPIIEDLIIGGFAAAPFVTLLVQVAKRLGLPDGYGGWLALGLSVVFVVVALAAQWFGVEPQAANVLGALYQIAQAMAALLGAAAGSAAWFKVGRAMRVM